jgi:NAD(P)-dependent dehydrogenase (short-subunit alcohol dehydrogenase family)
VAIDSPAIEAHMKSLFDLTNKVAVVTGASRGIGKAIALRLAQHGASVVVSSRKLQACEPVVQEIRAQGGQAIAVACHIAFKEQLETLIQTAVATFGGLDVVVGNAAVNPYFGSSLDMPDEAFDKVMASNVKSNVWLANLAIPQLRKRGGGSIIIVSSIGGFLGSDVIGAYAISKAADLQIARNICVEFGHENIRANCIAPGLIRTDFAKALWENDEIAKQRMRTTPLRRIGEPDEIAGAAVFLASAAGQYMTGQAIIIDGGRVAGSPSEFA